VSGLRWFEASDLAVTHVEGSRTSTSCGHLGVLAWLTPPGGSSQSGFKSPLEFLWKPETASASAWKIGWTLVIVAAARGLISLLPPISKLSSLFGVLAVAVAVVFGVQVGRLVHIGHVFDWLSAGMYLAFAAGLLLTISSLLPSSSARR
jgi:hypothetical protein